MQPNKRHRHSIMLLAATFIIIAQAAATGVGDAWQKLTNDRAFDYRDQKEALQSIQSPQDSLLRKLSIALIDFLTSPAGKLIGWLVFFLVVGWALYKIFIHGGISLFSKKPSAISGALNGEDAPDTLATANWEYHFNNAAATGDTRMAIRFSYLQLLQILQRNGLIQYRSDKTNNDYIHELIKQEYRQPFRQLSRQYEYVWYGHYSISQAAYDEYIRTFIELKNRLRTP